MQSNSRNFALPETNISQGVNLRDIPESVVFNSTSEWLRSSKAISIFLGFLKLSLSLRTTDYIFRLLVVFVNGFPNLSDFPNVRM